MKKMLTGFFFACLLIIAFAATDTYAQPGIRNSEFNGASPDTFWNWVDPLGNDTLSMTGTQARISVVGPAAHEPVAFSQGGNRAPRLIQRVSPPGVDIGDFDVFAKFDGAQRRQYQMQGILAVQDDRNFVRCELFSDSGATSSDTAVGMNYLLFTFDNSGNYAQTARNLIPLPAGPSFYLRLARIDSNFYQFYATDTTNWIFTRRLVHHMIVDSIGVYAANGDSVAFGSNTSPSFVGLIDFFRNWTGPRAPVQLGSFTATLLRNRLVILNWMTVSETNNYGFEVQKSLDRTADFRTIENSFVPGHGTTLQPQFYSWTDETTTAGHWYYRLKQIDLDGTIHFTDPVQIDIVTGVSSTELPSTLSLKQNYPNPFNPTTIIKYELPKESRVTLEVFNILGQKVAALVDEIKQAGFHEQKFDASQLTSGVYLYKLSSDGQSINRKMMLTK